MDDREVRERVGRVEEALEAVEGLPAAPRETALEAVGALVDLYGEGWARALARVEDARPGGADSLAEDELVGHLLMIHGLHPRGVEARVRAAVEELEDFLASRGREAELLAVEDGVARLRLEGTANGAAPGEDPREALERAILGAAPELERVEVEEPDPPAAEHAPRLVQLRNPHRPDGRPGGERPRAGEGS